MSLACQVYYDSFLQFKCLWILCQNENVLNLNYLLPATIQTNVKYLMLHFVLLKTDLVLGNFGCCIHSATENAKPKAAFIFMSCSL